jgi:hypothetical protein
MLSVKSLLRYFGPLVGLVDHHADVGVAAAEAVGGLPSRESDQLPLRS